MIRTTPGKIRLLCLCLSAFVPATYAQIHEPAWVRDAIFYQIFPERFANGDTSNDPPGTEPWGGKPTTTNYFGGDLRGIINHLDHLTELGVNALYLNPIFASNTNHKYHTSDYLKIDPHFGDERVFRELVDSCHARGIRIILDAVFNHTGTDFFAFRDIERNGIRSKYLGWYNIYSLPLGPPSHPNYECWWGLGDLPKLMTTNPDVEAYLFEVTRHWMSFGIDGWRLDVPNEIPHEFWKRWRTLVKSLNPDAYIVGEIWNDATPWLKGDQFDAVMNYLFRNACVDFFALRKISVTQFDSLLSAQRTAYPPEVNYALQNLLGSHDTERFLTLCGGNTAAMKLAVLFQMTYPGAPMVYYGDEVGMAGKKDPGCRGTMIWTRSDWNRGLFEFYRTAIALRNSYAVFRQGKFNAVLRDDRDGVYAYRRSGDNQTALVVLNISAQERRAYLRLSGSEENMKWRRLLPAGDNGGFTAGKSIAVDVPALSGIVLIGGMNR